ncbi:MAG: trk/ktr system potassium uptake protein, partial [Campylobacterota bacterium]|nr:trk/ktr system potassium uptake protein [Campylobacterota bacterium]
MEHKYVKTIFYGYIIIILTGALLLMLPASHIGELSFIDAIFTSASATCVTGLIVTSTSENFTFMGEFIILLLLQIGGIGYMTLVTVFFLFVKNSLSMDEKRVMKQSLDMPDLHVNSFVKKILSLTLAIELIGATVLTIQFSESYDLLDALWQGIFHSVSAFNNAGFSLFTDSLIGYNNDTVTILTLSFLVILG